MTGSKKEKGTKKARKNAGFQKLLQIGSVVAAKTRVVRICTNDPMAKAREVGEVFDKCCDPNDPHRVSMTSLYERGTFRHADDVYYAWLMLNGGKSIDDVEDDIEQTYREIHHHCDPVYPS